MKYYDLMNNNSNSNNHGWAKYLKKVPRYKIINISIFNYILNLVGIVLAVL